MREWATASRWSVGSVSAVVTAIAGLVAATAALVQAANGRPVWLVVVGGCAAAALIGFVIHLVVRPVIVRRVFRTRVSTSPYLRELRLVGADTWGVKVDIEQIYQDVSLGREVHWSPDSVRTFGFTARPGQRIGLDTVLRRAGSAVVAIRGIPGSGKSTLLRHTALRLVDAGGRGAVMPLLIVLAHHFATIVAGRDAGLAEVAASARWLDGSAVRASDVERWLRRGHCLVMLDGLDEVPEEFRRTVVDWAERAVERYRHITVVVTSRPHGFASASLDTADVLLELRELTEAQIQDFVHACYRAMSTDDQEPVTDPEARAEELLGRLRDQPKLRDLASNPLLLHLIVYVHHHRDGGLPSDRVELYRELVDLLVHKRRTSAGLGGAGPALSVADRLTVIEGLALDMMTAERTELDAEAVAAALSGYPEADAAVFLAGVQDNGIMVPAGRNSWAFAHLTLQEYLAARHIARRGEPRVLIDNIGRSWWRETTLLWASDNDPGELVAAALHRKDVDGWDLAIQCVTLAEARGIPIDPALRREVDRVLAGDFPVDSEEFTIAARLAVRSASSPEPGSLNGAGGGQ